MVGNRITRRATLMLGIMNDCKPNKISLQDISAYFLKRVQC